MIWLLFGQSWGKLGNFFHHLVTLHEIHAEVKSKILVPLEVLDFCLEFRLSF